MPAPQRYDSDSDSEDERPDPAVGMEGIVDAISEYGYPYLITLINGQCRWFREEQVEKAEPEQPAYSSLPANVNASALYKAQLESKWPLARPASDDRQEEGR